jgi:hypothetical protein
MLQPPGTARSKSFFGSFFSKKEPLSALNAAAGIAAPYPDAGEKITLS